MVGSPHGVRLGRWGAVGGADWGNGGNDVEGQNKMIRLYQSELEEDVHGAILIAEAASAVDAFLEESGVRLTNCPAPDAEAAYARALQEEAADLSNEYPRKEVLETFRRELGREKYAAYFADC